jgi:hypothetical protein
LRKATICFVMSVRPSVRPHGTTRLPLDGFSWNLIRLLRKLSRKFKFHYNRTRITGTLHEDRYTFSITFRSVLLRTKSISDQSCRETRNKHFVFNTHFRKSCHLWDNVEKFCRAGQPTDDNMAHAHCMLGTYGYQCTDSWHNTHCFSTAIMDERTSMLRYMVRTFPVFLNLLMTDMPLRFISSSWCANSRILSHW